MYRSQRTLIFQNSVGLYRLSVLYIFFVSTFSSSMSRVMLLANSKPRAPYYTAPSPAYCYA